MKRSTLIFPIKNGKVTLARKKAKVGVGLWNGYGGKEEDADKGSMQRCAVREFFDETDGARIRVEDLELVAHIDFYKAGEYIFECYVYFVGDWEGEIKETPEMGPPSEFSIAEPPLEEMMPGDRLWLERIFSGERIRAKVFYNADNTEVLDFCSEPL